MIVLLKSASKLLGLFLLLLLSFIYTDKVFSEARNSDPVMKLVMSYKKENDVRPVEPKIKDDEMILGLSGLEVNARASYKNMKQDDKFSEDKIVYDTKLPENSISKNYEYYITQGNDSKELVSIIFRITSDDYVDKLLSLVAQTNVSVNFFVDGSWLEENVERAFSMNNLDAEIYNLGYDGAYDKSMISVTNNLIESITLKDSNLCLNVEKNDGDKELCAKRKMHTITPNIINPSISELKKKLNKGEMIVFDASEFDYNNFKLMVNTITSRGYEIVGLSDLIKE